MIITDIKQIDHVAEETFGTAKGLISVDMKDYAFIKEHSESLKAIYIEVTALSDDVVHSLDEVFVEVGKENLCNILLYIKGCGSDAGMRVITVEQLNLFIEAFNKHFEVDDFMWSMGNDNKNCENISILIILGYDKR